MRTAIFCVFSIAIAGCVAPKPVSLPDGAKGLAIDCSGTANTWASCMNDAAKACNGPYKVISQDGGSSGGAVVGNVLIAAIDRTMIVQCGPTP